MADPAYINTTTGVITDGDAVVLLASASPTGSPIGSDVATIEFASTTGTNNWSQYQDLRLITSAKTGYAGAYTGYVIWKCNGNTGTIYDSQDTYSDGSNAVGLAINSSGGYLMCASSDASVPAEGFGVGITDFYNINSGGWKTVHSRSGNQWASGTTGLASFVQVRATTFMATEPIDSIDFISNGGGDLLAGSRFDLFGILPRMVEQW